MYQTDSTLTDITTAEGGAAHNSNANAAPPHPSRILKSLPADATPAQQDSAIQASIKVENTHLSNRPDTLHLPLAEKGKSIKDISIPIYYKENFFSNDSLYHPEISGGRHGTAGDPVPYSVKGDSIITAILLGNFILAAIAFAKSRRFISVQARNFFFESRESKNEIAETTNEIRFQFFLMLQTCLMLSVIAFIYTLERVADTFVLDSQYQLTAIFFGTFTAYFFMKFIIRTFVNRVFFNRHDNSRWLKSSIFITSMEGVVLFPLVMLLTYFNLSIENAAIYVAVVIISAKIMALYKCIIIFFKRKSAFLQIFLYFCALEIMPLLLICGTLAIIIDYLKINFS